MGKDRSLFWATDQRVYDLMDAMNRQARGETPPGPVERMEARQRACPRHEWRSWPGGEVCRRCAAIRFSGADRREEAR